MRWMLAVFAPRSDALALLALIGLGLALRLAFFYLAPVFVHGDSYQYYRPAHLLMDGAGFPLPLKRPPVYPVFLAVLGRWMGDDLRNVVAVQHLLGLGTVALTYGVGRLTIGRGVGLLSGLVAALAGPLLIFEHYVLTETLFTFLISLSAFLLLLGFQTGSRWFYLGGGLAVGAATLTRPHAQIILLLVPLVAVVRLPRWRPVLWAAGLTGLSVATLILPWMVRNQISQGSFSVAGSAGQSLIRNLAFSHPRDFVFFDLRRESLDSDPNLLQAQKMIQAAADNVAKGTGGDVWANTLHAQLMRILTLNDAEADALMRQVAEEAIRARPMAYAHIVFDDTRMTFIGRSDDLWDHWNNAIPSDERAQLTERMRSALPEQEAAYPFTLRLVNIYQSAWLGPVVPLLFLVGLLASAVVPGWRLALIPGLIVLSLHVVSAATAGFVPRYHHPPDPLMHVVAFGGALSLYRLGTCLQTSRPGTRRRAAAPRPTA